MPSEAVGRARLNEWCYFIMSELDAGSLYVVRRHDGLKQIYGEAPTAVESAKSYFLHNLEAMAARIGSDNTYLFGDQLSVADILLMTCLDWALSCGILYRSPCRTIDNGLRYARHIRQRSRRTLQSRGEAFARINQRHEEPDTQMLRPYLHTTSSVPTRSKTWQDR